MQGSVSRLHPLCLRPVDGDSPSPVVTAPASSKGTQFVLRRSLSDAADAGRLGSYVNGRCTELAA